MKSPRSVSKFALAFALALTALPGAPPVARAAAPGDGVMELVEKLGSSDFRVRVQAALILGKTSDPAALPALVRGLTDKSAAVRAASAAALGTYGDPAAIAALETHVRDESDAVVRQVKSALASLHERSRADAVDRKKATIFVKLSGVQTHTHAGAESLGIAGLASRGALGKMHGIALLYPSEDPEAAFRQHKRPVVVMTASIRELQSSKSNGEFVVSANVEFLMQAAPEFAIVGKISGTARASGDLASTADAGGRARVQEAALGAAVESALGKSRDALLAAGRRG